jgi:hypothetical protein
MTDSHGSAISEAVVIEKNHGASAERISSPTTFGEITSAGSSSLPAPLMQFALRYEF